MRIGLGCAVAVPTEASTVSSSVTIASLRTLRLARWPMAGPPCVDSMDEKTVPRDTSAVGGHPPVAEDGRKGCPRYRARRIAPPVGIGTVSQVGQTLPAPLQSCQGAFAGAQ